MSNFNKIRKIFSGIRKEGELQKLNANSRIDDNQNVDQLITKPNLYAYVLNDKAENIEETGIQNISKDEEYKNHFKNVDPIINKCVLVYFCRIPSQGLDNTQKFLETHSPIRISLMKMKRSENGFKIYAFKFPNDTNNKLTEIKPDQLESLCRKESSFFKYFKDSNDELLKDVPMAAIYCPDGTLPGFCCKYLNDKTN